MKKINRALALLLVGTMLLSGCSMLTAQGRRERAYERYVRKSSLGRVKQQRRLSLVRLKIPRLPPSHPVANAEVTGPQSATSGDGGM
ncbi:MAG: hypothetical protein ACREIF_15640 [Chthoniobacterales bacterium]